MSVADERLLKMVARGLSNPWLAGHKAAGRARFSSWRRVVRRSSSSRRNDDPDRFRSPSGRAVRGHRRSRHTWSRPPMACSTIRSARLSASGHRGVRRRRRRASGAATFGRSRDQLKEDGLDKRIAVLGRTVVKQNISAKYLRIAGLLAHVSGGVSDVERNVLGKLAAAFQLDPKRSRLALDAVRSRGLNLSCDVISRPQSR